MILVSVLLAAGQQAVPFISTGDPLLQPRCGARVDTFELVITAPARPERLTSTMVRTRQRVTEAGASRCVITQRYDRPSGSDLDSSVVDLRTLMPNSYTATVGTDHHRFAFTGDNATGTVQRDDSLPRRIVQAAPRSYFLGVADLEVIRALPLAAGLRAQFDVFNPPGGFRTVTVHVAAMEGLTLRGRNEMAWRVEYGAGAAPTVLWLSVAGRDLIRSRSELRDGAVFWRRLQGDTVP